MAKTFIQDAIDRTLKPYESSKMGFLKFDEKDIENLRNKLYAMIIGNEDSYKEQIDNRISEITLKLKEKELKEEAKIDAAAIENFGEDVEVSIHNNVPSKAKIDKKFNAGKAVGVIATLTVVLATTAVSCGKKEKETEETKPMLNVELVDKNVEVEEIDENKIAAEQILMQFSTNAKDSTSLAINSLLNNGVKLIDKNLNEESQKDLLSSEWLQYYLVANIDDITTLEYANFVKEQPGAVIDNDDLIYNFREMNVLLKGQMLVSTVGNEIDFSSLYLNENDAKLLNDGADIIARLNDAVEKDERKALSKEFYDYIQNTILDQTDKLKYSNSAMATFINVEFGAWCELTKNSNYKKGYYPDDELEAKLMTVISNCGMSKGEETTLNIEDETKKSLESINVIRVLDSLNQRKENITTLISLGQLYYIDEAIYGNLKLEVSKNIDLSKYNEIESYTEKKEAELKNVKPQTHKNDSGVSNGQGGTIAKDDMIANGVNPSDPNAKEKYEEAVKENTETTVFKDNQGNVVDENEAKKWAQQGAKDANNGINNINNVPELYKSSYITGWNAAKTAIDNAQKNSTSNSEFVGTNPETVEKTETEEIENFKDDNKQSSNNDNNQDTTVEDDVETKTEFVPIDGETTITETEEVTGFVEERNANRTINVKILTREEKVESYKELKALLQQAMNGYQEAINIYDEIETNHMSK